MVDTPGRRWWLIANARALEAEGDLDEAVKQIAAMSDEMGKVEGERDELREWREKASGLLLCASALLRIWIDEAPAGSALTSETMLTHIDALLAKPEGEEAGG